jgi:beta-glucosidase
MATLRRLIPDDQPHPRGSEEQTALQNRLVQILEELNLEPELQESWTCSPQGPCGDVRNILVHFPGESRQIVLFSAHTDSTEDSPGAGDNGQGVAILVELARQLRDKELENSVTLLFTDGEEDGRLGSIAFVESHPLAARVAVAVNLEARGQSGRSSLFRTAGEDAWLIDLYASHAPDPFSSSVHQVVFEAMPHYTDLATWESFGIPGVDFAFIEQPEAYHSPLDTVDRLDPRSVQSQGDNALAMLEGLSEADLSHPPRGHAAWFDVMGLGVVHWPRSWTFWLALLGAGLTGAACLLLRKTRDLRLADVGAGMMVVLLALTGSILLGWGLSKGIVSLEPGHMVLAMVAGCLTGSVGLGILSRRLSALSMHLSSCVFMAWSALPLALFYPGLAHLLVLPSAFATLGCLAAQRWPWSAASTGALLGLLVAATLWLPMLDGIRIALGAQGIGVLAGGTAMVLCWALPLWRGLAPRSRARWVLLLPIWGLGCQAPTVDRPPIDTPMWWGVATSPYQVEDPGEGQFTTDWDLFYDRGRLREPRGEGVGSWSQMGRDRDALVELGVSHYRFGIEWARVEPEPGQIDYTALERYAEHAQALREAGIEPVVCLWHFTFPDWATDLDRPEANGWLHPQTAQRWGPYVEAVADALGPHVRLWAPQNEPNAQAMAGYFLGQWPPGVSGDLGAVADQTEAAVERFNEAASILRSRDPDAQILTIQNIIAFEAQTWDALGVFTGIGEEYNHAHLEGVHEQADFIGFNYYYRRDATPSAASEQTWPRGIRIAIEELQTRYDKPIVVMENGLGTDDDRKRQAYLRAHLFQVELARSEGWDVRGYFAWSLVDNYEWALGWGVRYGLYAHVEGRLVAKESARLYSRFIRGEERP